MVHLYLIRHGETDANLAQAQKIAFVSSANVNEGELATNVPLNDTGREQVRKAAAELPDTIDAVFSSPLLRVKETAEIICKEKGIDLASVIIRDELKEYEKGILEHLPFAEIDKHMGKNMEKAALECSYDYTSVGGDSWKTIYNRVENFLDEIKSMYDGKTVVCATSGGVIRMFYKVIFKDINPTISTHLRIKNASISEFLI